MTPKKKNRKAGDLLKQDLLGDFAKDPSSSTNSQSLKLVPDDSQVQSNSILVEDTVAGFWKEAQGGKVRDFKAQPKNEIEEIEAAIGHDIVDMDSKAEGALLSGNPEGMAELNLSTEDDPGHLNLNVGQNQNQKSRSSVVSFNESLEQGREKKKRSLGNNPVVTTPSSVAPVEIAKTYEAPEAVQKTAISNLKFNQTESPRTSNSNEVYYEEAAETRVAGSEEQETVAFANHAETKVGHSEMAETRVGHSEMAETRVAGSEIAETHVAVRQSENPDADFLNDYGVKDIGQELDLAAIPDKDLMPDRIREVNFDSPSSRVKNKNSKSRYQGPSVGDYQPVDEFLLKPKQAAEVKAAVVQEKTPVVEERAPIVEAKVPTPVSAPNPVFVPDPIPALAAVNEAPYIPPPPVASMASDLDDKTLPLSSMAAANFPKDGTAARTDIDRTLAVPGFSNRNRLSNKKEGDVKVAIGNFINSRPGSANVFTSADASLAQSEALRVAQSRIAELEREVDVLRLESHEIASSADLVSQKNEDQKHVLDRIEREHSEVRSNLEQEIAILRDNLDQRTHEMQKARVKIEELESKLKSDFRKIRVRERELENRLELLRAEKSSIVRSKDEYILEQKRKTDQITLELGNYREKVVELNKLINENQDQFRRTEKALRLALTNLESKTESPLKKAN